MIMAATLLLTTLLAPPAEARPPKRVSPVGMNLSPSAACATLGEADPEGKRIGQRSDSKSDAPKGVVGSNPMSSADCG